MKTEFNKEWCMRMADLEDGKWVGAGLPLTVESQRYVGDLNLAFGKLIKLMRRSKRLTIDKLASRISIDIDEIIEIENDPHFKPSVRSVYQLAQEFEIPSEKLLELAGLITTKNQSFSAEALKFAARSEPLVALSKEEEDALNSFVKLLSSKIPDEC